MKLKTTKLIIEDLSEVRSLLRQIQNRLVNLDLEPELQLAKDAINIIMRTDNNIVRNLAIIDENLKYISLNEFFKADQSLLKIHPHKIYAALCLTGLVELNSEMDVEMYFIENKIKMNKEQDPEITSFYDIDYFHIFAVVFALAYTRAQIHREEWSLR